MATAHYAEHLGISTNDARALIQAGMEERRRALEVRPTRRAFLQGMGAAALVAPGLAAPRRARATKAAATDARIAIVGGGIGGLSCAYELLGKGRPALPADRVPPRPLTAQAEA